MKKIVSLLLLFAVVLISVTACSDGKSEEEKQAEAAATALSESGLGGLFNASAFAEDRDVKNWDFGKSVNGIVDDVNVTIDEIVWVKKVADPNSGLAHTADGTFAVVFTSISNNSEESVKPDDETGNLYVEDASGRQFNQTLLLLMDYDYVENTWGIQTADIARPSKTIRSVFVVDVPDSSTDLSLRSEKLGIAIPVAR